VSVLTVSFVFVNWKAIHPKTRENLRHECRNALNEVISELGYSGSGLECRGNLRCWVKYSNNHVPSYQEIEKALRAAVAKYVGVEENGFTMRGSVGSR
jgi:hypothetical protein